MTPPIESLQRVLTLQDLIAFGIATTLGSGGFNLIHEGVKHGGKLFPIALTAIAFLFQGASKAYEEAYKVFKSNTAEGDIVEKEFGTVASTITSSSIIAFNVFSVSTILVLASKAIFPKGEWHGQIGFAILLLSLMSGFSLKGIVINKEVISIFSLIIVLLLMFTSYIGIFGPVGKQIAPPFAQASKTSLMKSMLYFYFVLSGFDDLIKFVEETKNPDCDIPRSFYISNAISTILTAGVAFAFTRTANSSSSQKDNPIGTIIERFLGPPSANVVYWFGIFIMLITAFVSFLAISRYLYGLGERVKEEGVPDSWIKRVLIWLQELNSNKVPWRSSLVGFLMIACGILMNHTDTLVMITDFFLTVVLGTVTAAVAKMRWGRGEKPWVETAAATGFLGILSTYVFPF